jgi:thiosulfate dehydrogenase
MLSCRNIIFVLLAVQFGMAPAMAQQKQAPQNTTWPQPDLNRLPAGIWKDSVVYGHKLVVETYNLVGPEIADKTKRYSGNNLACQNCHLDGGRQRFALPLVGVYGAFPAYMARENDVRTLEDRINGCFERSMNGRALPVEGKEMKSLVAYIQFLSAGVPVGANIVGRSVPPLPLLTRAADPRRGGSLYQNNCASCHQPDGRGMRNGAKGDVKGYQYPPLWGPDSFNDGAGMHRLISSAGFIHANMPFGTTYKAPALSADDAWDIAAYINSQPRPKRAHLDRDYPDRSRKPADAPFPPFDDQFSLKQHQLGPFQPIVDAHKASAKSAR